MPTLYRVATHTEVYGGDAMEPSPLRVLRALRNLSASELARLADIDRATVRRLERGEHRPQGRTAQKIAAVLSCPAELLFPPVNDETQPGRAGLATTPAGGDGRCAAG